MATLEERRLEEERRRLEQEQQPVAAVNPELENQSAVDEAPIPAIAPVNTVDEQPVVAPAPQETVPQPEALIPQEPEEPSVSALTTNRQIESMSQQITGQMPVDPATGLPTVDPITAQRLAIRAKQGGRVGREAQSQLQDLGVTAPIGKILGESDQMIKDRQRQYMTSPEAMSINDRKRFEQDQERAKAVLTKQRDDYWEKEKLEMDMLRNDEARGMAGLNKQKTELAIKDDQRKYEEALKTQDAQRAILKQQLRGLELSGDKTEAANAQRQAIATRIEALNRPIQPRVIKSTQAISSAQDIREISGVNGADLREVGTLYNAPSETIQNTIMGQMAASYSNGLELAEDATGVVYEDGVGQVTGLQMNVWNDEVAAEVSLGTAPDDAVNKILDEADITPEDPDYNNKVLAIAANVRMQYVLAGQEGLGDIQELLQADKAQSDATIKVGMNSIAENPETYASIFLNKIQSAQEAIDISEQAGLSGIESLQLESAAYGSLGFRKQESMEAEEINEVVIKHLMEENKEDTKVYKEFVRMLDPAKRTADEKAMLKQVEPLLRKGFKVEQEMMDKKMAEVKAEEAAKTEKIAIQHEKDVEKASKYDFVVRWDENETPVYFPSEENARLYDSAPPSMKQGIAQQANDVTAKKLADPGYQAFLELKNNERTEILTQIRLAKAIWKQKEDYGAKPSNAELMKISPLITNVEELPEAVNALAEMWGQDSPFAIGSTGETSWLGSPILSRELTEEKAWQIQQSDSGNETTQAIKDAEELLNNKDIDEATRTAIEVELAKMRK